MAAKGPQEIDFNSWSLDDLKKLHRDVGKAIDSYETRRKQEALAAAEAVLKEHGFSISDLVGGGTAKPKKGSEAKYRHPENASLTWSGRGRQPGWIKDGLANGKSLEDFLIRR